MLTERTTSRCVVAVPAGFKVLSELPEVTLNGKPTAIISSTQKGQGVTFMEASPSAWHIGGFSDETLEETIELIEAYTKERLAEVEK